MPKGQGQRGNIGDKVDRDLLHEFMWKHADHNGRFTMSQKELADALSVSVYTMSTIFHEMLVSGRLRKVKWNFFVMEPNLWRWKNPPTSDPPRSSQPSLL